MDERYELSALLRYAQPLPRLGQGSVRRQNLSLVLRHLRDAGPRARAEIAAETGLRKATVTSLVGDLVEGGLVAEREVTHTGQSGRPSKPVGLHGEWTVGLGIELGADRIVGVVTDLTGRSILERELPIGDDPPGSDSMSASAVSFIAGLLDEVEQRSTVAVGVCLSLAGRVDASRTPTVDRLASDWRYDELVVLVGEELSRRSRTRPELLVESEANLAALAERRSRHHGGANNLVGLMGRGGVDAGVLLDDTIVRGSGGLFGDVGHIIVDSNGGRCRCGSRGCWETVVGLQAILREAAPDLAGNPHQQGRLSTLVEQVVERAGVSNQRAVEGLDRVGHWLGIGLASIVAMLNPEVIVLDGTFRVLSPWLLDSALGSLAKHGRTPSSYSCTIAVSKLDGSAPALGASLLASRSVFVDPLAIISDRPAASI